MDRKFLETSVEIAAPAAKVWRVFIDPELTRQMGGEYVTDWKVGGSFGFRGTNGIMFTNGVILRLEPERLLQHSLLEPDATGDADAESPILSLITYTLHEENGHTTLTGREDFAKPMIDFEYQEALDGWEEALKQVKRIAEEA